MDVCNTEDFTRDEHGFIFEISKEVVLPSIYWKSEHLNIHNSKGFYQQDTNDVTVKKVNFYNNLVPIIQIFGKKYEYKMPITTKKELEDLLEKIDNIEKCYGSGGFEQCIGYLSYGLKSNYKCFGCQGLVKIPVLQRMKSKIETIQSLNNRVSLLEDLKS